MTEKVDSTSIIEPYAEINNIKLTSCPSICNDQHKMPTSIIS